MYTHTHILEETNCLRNQASVGGLNLVIAEAGFRRYSRDAPSREARALPKPWEALPSPGGARKGFTVGFV